MLGQFKFAKKLLIKSLAFIKKDSLEEAFYRKNLAWIILRMGGSNEEALKELKEAKRYFDEIVGYKDRTYVGILYRIGEIKYAEGQY